MRGKDLAAAMGKKKFGKRTTSRKGGGNRREAVESSIVDNFHELIVGLYVDDSYTQQHFKIKQLAGRLHATDSAAIREVLNNAPAIDTKIEIECPKCGAISAVELPISESFFRPSRSK